MATIKLGSTKVANSLIAYAEKKAVEKSGIDCSPEYAKSQFSATRQMHGKTGGIQAHHVIQSFLPGETTPKQANEIGVELAKKLAEGYESLIYTHADKDHIHNHIVINSVSHENGYKFQLHGRKSIDMVREISDSICEDYGLSVVKEPSAKVRYTQAEQGILERGEVSWKDVIREAIDYEKSNSDNYDEFKKNLEENHCIEVNDKRKHITYRLEGFKRVVRGKTLGMDYERGVIENGFERQIGREQNFSVGVSSERNKRTESVDEELHKSSSRRGHGEESYTGGTTGESYKHIKQDSTKDDFDIEKARDVSGRLRKELNRSYGEWKESDGRKQQRGALENGQDRDKFKEINEEHGRHSKESTGVSKERSSGFSR
ncbi:MAG TPA: hypothetical protein ENN12_03210 [Epsilonproteobacteria bacterium]|nr:hypothetical protein [Campylobacterota bacterium]